MDYKVNIDVTDVGVDWNDAGRWRCFGFVAYGNNIDEVYENVCVYETDQDGGEIGCYGLEMVRKYVRLEIENFISNYFKN